MTSRRKKLGPRFKTYFETVPLECTSLQLKKNFWHKFFHGEYYFVPFSMTKKKGGNDLIKELCKEDPRALGVIITTEKGEPTTGILVCL